MSRQYKAELFKAHAQDLQQIFPDIGNLYLCPICLREFLYQDLNTDLDNEELSVGDVWPKYLRGHSEKASRQQVLLCKRCNSKAGDHGDHMMQIIAQLSEERRIGKTYTPRRIRVASSSGWQEVANLEAFVEHTGQKQVRLSFPKYKKKSQRLHFEKELEKFRRHATQEPVNITIYPPGGGHPHNPFGDLVDWPLAQIGFLTSAYLLAFYTFGYRYILDRRLDFVRGCITGSFTDAVQKLPKSGVPSVRVCDTHYHEDPQIDLVVHLDGNTHPLLQISVLSFHIDLPFPEVHPAFIAAILDTKDQTFAEEALHISIGCNKSDGHDCMWDYVLGKPILKV